MRGRAVLAGAALLLAVTVAGGAAPGADALVVDAECFGQVVTITGAGTIVGTSGDDVILGSDGADVIYGNGGHDLICGGDGADTIYGGSGDDDVAGEGGEDSVYGNSGDDALTGETEYAIDEAEVSAADHCADGADDLIKGGSGGDYITDQCGYNSAYGEGGSDFIDVTGLADGGSGDDNNTCFFCTNAADGVQAASHNSGAIRASESCDDCHDAVAKGGSGGDAVRVDGGTADGGSGNDRVVGLGEGDLLKGGAGNDDLDNESDDSATLNGGAGYDECESDDPEDDTFISCEEIDED